MAANSHDGNHCRYPLDCKYILERCKLGDVIECPVERSKALEIYERMGGARIRELQYSKYALAYLERDAYFSLILRALDRIDVDPEGSVAVDLGSGDGRFTELLVKKGFYHVIAVDNVKPSLQRLIRFMKSIGASNRVTALRADLTSTPIVPNSVDLVLAIESLYYLNERYEEALRRIHNILRPGGYLVEAEPDAEGMALIPLILGRLEEFIELSKRRAFRERYGDELEGEFRAFLPDELEKIHSSHGFIVKYKGCLPIYSLIVRILNKKGVIGEEELARYDEQIRMLVRDLALRGCSCRRINLVVSMKPRSQPP